MATISMLPMHNQIQTASLTITPSYTTLMTNAQFGQYTLSLIINSTFSFLITIVLLPGDLARCTSIIGCGMGVDQFYNNTATCPLLDNVNNNYTLQFQYLSGNLSVQTILGGNLTGCTFYMLFGGVGMPNNGTCMMAVDQIQSSTGSIISFINDITGTNSTFTNFNNIVSITGSFQLNSKPVLTTETLDFIPIPINYTNTQITGATITNTYFGTIYEITKPIIFNKILCSVNQGISSTGSSPRVSIYQTSNGNNANNINLANLISTATGSLGITASPTDTNLTLIPTGTNTLVPGVAYFLCSNDTGANFTYYSYTNSSFRILNSNIITGASTTFTTSIPSKLPPATFDPTAQTPTVTNVGTVFRLCK